MNYKWTCKTNIFRELCLTYVNYYTKQMWLKHHLAQNFISCTPFKMQKLLFTILWPYYSLSVSQFQASSKFCRMVNLAAKGREYSDYNYIIISSLAHVTPCFQVAPFRLFPFAACSNSARCVPPGPCCAIMLTLLLNTFQTWCSDHSLKESSDFYKTF